MRASLDLERVIRGAMEKETQRVIAEEIEAATDRVRQRLQAQAAQIAMAVMKHYEFYRDEQRIVITVKHMDADNTTQGRG